MVQSREDCDNRIATTGISRATPVLDLPDRMEFQPPLPAFYSYAHKKGRDRRYLEDLRDALAESRREGVIREWDDSHIKPGDNWEDTIIERARQSRVFLFILTDRFIASDFCVETELTIALALHAKRAAVLALILAEEANWKLPKLAKFQAIMPGGKPVNKSRDGWTKVGQAVRQAADDFLAGKLFADAGPTLPAIPYLLPFTIGREQVIDNFEAALRTAPPLRPFVCILTGKRQGQTELVDYLLSDVGPVRTVLSPTGAHYPVEIDAGTWVGSSDPAASLLTGALASRVEPTPTAEGREGLAASFAGLGLSVVRCELSAAQWRACGASRLQQFFDYWAGWPTLDGKSPIIVFLSIGAETGNLATQGGIRLPLPSLTRQITVDWLATQAARRRFLANQVQAHLDEVFRTQASLPMEIFAPRIDPILRKFQII